jgi:hypothetical protein
MKKRPDEALTDEELDEALRPFVKALVAEDVADRLRKGEIVIVGTTPDGKPIYQKARAN